MHKLLSFVANLSLTFSVVLAAQSTTDIDGGISVSRLQIVFQRTAAQQAELDRLLKEQQDPVSPNYHRWLTPEQFGERFGPSREMVRGVEEWLRSEGLSVGSVARGRGWLRFEGTERQLARAFRTELSRRTARGKTYLQRTSRLTIPHEFDGIVRGVRGFGEENWQARPQLAPRLTAPDGSHLLGPADVRVIYTGYGNTLTGQGQRIAVVGQSALDLNDIRKFRQYFQLPANDPEVLLGGDDPGRDRGVAFQEAQADVEWAGGMAPDAHIVYVYATSALDAAQKVIDDNLAPVMSFSFGMCERAFPSEYVDALRSLAQQANAQGITWAAASGDSGAAGCDAAGSPLATKGLGVWLPASLPEVTAVGGTELDEGGNGIYWPLIGYIPEKAWKSSGGGTSVLFDKPYWQSAPGVPNDAGRNVPDISVTASPVHDPYMVLIGGNFYAMGGTSLGAPVIAGMLAWGNQYRREHGLPDAGGNINVWLYDRARRGESIHDVTRGDNMLPCTAGSPDCVGGWLGFSAGPGYDRSTGLGSPNGLLTMGLVSTVTSINASPTTLMQGQSINISMKVDVDPRVASLTKAKPSGTVTCLVNKSGYCASGTPIDAAGQAAASYGPVNAPPGVYTLTATFNGDTNFAASTSAPFSITILPAPPDPPGMYWPRDGAVGVPLNAVLSTSIAESLYFGVTNPPPYWGERPFALSGLKPNTKYYWKCVARNVSGTAESPVWSFTTSAQPGYLLTRIAGNGKDGDAGDGGPASSASVRQGPLAVDAQENIYIAALNAPRIRKIAADGTISTVAGTGSETASGDGGPALAAGLGYPYGIAVDAEGNIYFTTNNRVRRIDPGGTISTIAGSDASGYAGDGGPAADALFRSPRGLAVDKSGALYIADVGNHCVRRISGGIISTAVGTCDVDGGVFRFPTAMTFDGAGRMYVVDELEYSRMNVFQVDKGTVLMVAGGAAVMDDRYVDMPGLSMRLAGVRSLCADSAGNVFFPEVYTNTGINLLYKWTAGSVSLAAGGGDFMVTGATSSMPATLADLLFPASCAVGPSGRVYFTDRGVVGMLSPLQGASSPTVTAGGVVNAASLTAGAVAPGSIASVFGDFGYVVSPSPSGDAMPSALSGLGVRFNALAAPLFYASSNQVNVQVPWEVSGNAVVSAVRNGQAGSGTPVSIVSFAPAIFAANGQGTGQGSVLDESYKLADVSNPAARGSVISIYCTGLGAVENSPATGAAASSAVLSRTKAPVTVTIGDQDAGEVLFAGLAPGTVGEYQVNVRVPAGVTPGAAVPLKLSVGGATSNVVTIAVH